jgi:hypothetical protein
MNQPSMLTWMSICTKIKINRVHTSLSPQSSCRRSSFTTRQRLTAGALKRLTAGVFAFAGDNLAGGNALPLAPSFSPVVTCYYPRRLRIFAGGICYHRHISHICRRQQYIFKELKKIKTSYPRQEGYAPAVTNLRNKKKRFYKLQINSYIFYPLQI